MKKQILFFVFLLVILSATLLSCHHYSRNVPEIPQNELPKVQVKIHRYGKALFSIDLKNFKTGLQKIKPQFLPFLNANLNDTANINKLYRYVTDTQIRYVYHKTMKAFPRLNFEQQQLKEAFAHIKYYFPTYHLPKVYTYISNLYYQQPVMKQGNTVVIALDDYLGKNFQLYSDLNIPLYHRRCMTRKNIITDVMRVLYQQDFRQPFQPKTLLDNMMEAGKELYFLDAMLPNTPDTLKICYTGKQLQWIKKNKKAVWAVLVNNRFLYSTDYMLLIKMTQPGPFSDGFSHASPPALARWFGWQMVLKYMHKYPKTTLNQLFKMKNAQTLLIKSGYKP